MMCSLVIASMKHGALGSEDRGLDSRSHDQTVSLGETVDNVSINHVWKMKIVYMRFWDSATGRSCCLAGPRAGVLPSL